MVVSFFISFARSNRFTFGAGSRLLGIISASLHSLTTHFFIFKSNVGIYYRPFSSSTNARHNSPDANGFAHSEHESKLSTIESTNETDEQGQQRQSNGTTLQYNPTNRQNMQKSLGFYVAIETTWHVCLFAACYRYRPLHRLTQTAAGRRMMHQAQLLWKGRNGTRNSNSSNKHKWQLPQWMSQIPISQRSMVAASEWFVLNKTAGIALFPSKLLLAGWLSKQFEKYKQEYGFPCILSTSSSSTTNTSAEATNGQSSSSSLSSVSNRGNNWSNNNNSE